MRWTFPVRAENTKGAGNGQIPMTNIEANPKDQISIRRRCSLAAAIAAILALLVACGGGDPGAAGGGGSLALRIRNAKGFNPAIEHGRVARFVVRIEGPGIAAPIEASFPGDAEEGVVEGVPAGADRIVSVRAENGNGAVIRAGEAPGVEVGDGLTEVEMALEAVPIFANLADGAAVENTRLVFRLFSDPESVVVVEDRTSGAPAILADLASREELVHLDASTGLGRLAPAVMAPGERLFAVRDAATGRETAVHVFVLDGKGRRPAPLASAAGLRPMCASELGMMWMDPHY